MTTSESVFVYTSHRLTGFVIYLVIRYVVFIDLELKCLKFVYFTNVKMLMNLTIKLQGRSIMEIFPANITRYSGRDDMEYQSLYTIYIKLFNFCCFSVKC